MWLLRSFSSQCSSSKFNYEDISSNNFKIYHRHKKKKADQASLWLDNIHLGFDLARYWRSTIGFDIWSRSTAGFKIWRAKGIVWQTSRRPHIGKCHVVGIKIQENLRGRWRSRRNEAHWAYWTTVVVPKHLAVWPPWNWSPTPSLVNLCCFVLFCLEFYYY